MEKTTDIIPLRQPESVEDPLTEIARDGARRMLAAALRAEADAFVAKEIDRWAQVVKAGDIVKVKVMEVDIPRNRVGLTMRMSDTPGEKVDGPRGGQSRGGHRGNQPRAERHSSQDKPAPANAAMASLFANAKQLRK